MMQSISDLKDLRQCMLHVVNDRKLLPESVNTFVTAAKFLYLHTLELPWGEKQVPRVRRPHKLPVVLSQEEVVLFFDHIPSLKYRAVPMACDGAGLRISEAVALKIADIDSRRMPIRVEQGKGQERPLRHAFAAPAGGFARVVASQPPRRPIPHSQSGYLFPGWRTSTYRPACRVGMKR